jgi:Tol biopolymer transport system component
MFALQTPVKAQNSQKLFQKGLIQEEGEGNLNKAIEIYNSLVNDVSIERALRAKALLHVGICYEKLGNQNARKSYQKLIAEFSDQDAIVALGLQQLKGLKSSDPIAKSAGIVASQVWSPAQDTYGVSPDGRYLNYIDWNNISINLKDLYTGETRVLSKVGTWKTPSEFPDNSVWSPDGKKLAYFWFIGDNTELRIVNVDGSSDRILAKGNRETCPWPIDWTPDGKYILASISDEIQDDKFHKIVLVSVNDGSQKPLKTLSDCGCYMDISPDNKYILYTLPQKDNSKNNDIFILSMDGKIDKKIVSDAANDANPVWAKDGNEILFVSDRYGTNDLWKLKVENGNPVGFPEIVKVDMGSRYRLFHVTKDKSVFYGTDNSRFDVYNVSLEHNKNEDAKKPLMLSKLNTKRNINPVWSPDGRYATYMRWPEHTDNVLAHQYLITVYDTKTNKSREIKTELYGHPNVNKAQWSPDGTKLLLYGILKGSLQGGLFLFDINTEKTTPIRVANNRSRNNMDFSNKLFRYSNDGESVFYISDDQKSILKYDIKTKQESTIITGTKTLLYYELSNDNSKLAFGYWFENNKEIFVASTSGGEKKKIFEADADCKCSPNVIAWGKDDKYLYFKEGKFRDLKKIHRVPVDGGEAEEVIVFKDVFENATIIGVDLHPDGNNMLVQIEAGKGGEIWKLDGLFND